MWRIYQPTEILFGCGTRKRLCEKMEERGLANAFVIAGKSQAGIVSELQAACGALVVGRSSDVEPDPTVENVDNNAALVKAAGADCIVALGGGSVIDCAKCVAVALADGCSGSELIAGHVVQRSLPVVAIPTTAGSGSEVTPAAGLNDKGRGIKGGVYGLKVFPALSIIDPELTCSAPPQVTACGGLDIIAHALDVLGSKNASPYTDALATNAARLAFEAIEEAYANGGSLTAREKMCAASVTAGMAVSQAGTGSSHACAAAISARFALPHGEACALTLDAWFSENAKARPVLNAIARQIGFENADALARRIHVLREKFNMRTRLSQLGATEADIPSLAEAASGAGSMKNNVAQTGQSGIETMFKNIL